MDDNRNTMLAILLSVVVLIAWQYFIGIPQMEKQKAEQKQQQTQQTQPAKPAQPGQGVTGPSPSGAPVPPGAPAGAAVVTRAAALAASPRIAIETPRIKGSIALKGARIDDVSLSDYRETVDPRSSNIVLLSPSGGPDPFYAEFGWTAAPNANLKLPGADTVWTAAGPGPLTPERPLVLTWNNGEGLLFRRTVAIDRTYMFTLTDEVENKGADPLTLFGYGLISRHGTPPTLGYYIFHEGPVGVLGDGKLYELSYKDLEKPVEPVKSRGGWLGITDKYWAATLIPDPQANLTARFSSGLIGTLRAYQTDYLLEAMTAAPGAKLTSKNLLFAGAKEVAVVDGYEKGLGIKNFDLLIDWGWFYFITKPLFQLLHYFYTLVGNFGLAILIVTVIIKIVFFPLANKSYASMARMKTVQPQMLAIRERYADDKVKQQQAMMELYKQEKINPLAGCLPILIQIPVFFALYKVLFVTIEMRHAPFYGWIKDLSGPDPTNLFNLFGLIPFDPTLIPLVGQFLHVGVWPLVMGVTMWAQMKLNPAPPDPTQKMIFDWMPLLFTFMLASFSAGLVIYWAWNNFLSVLQQSVIMSRHGAKIELWDNVKAMFVRSKPPAT